MGHSPLRLCVDEELLFEEDVGERLHVGRLLVVRGAAVPTFDVLVVQHFVLETPASCAIIFRACPGCTRSSRVEVVNSTAG